MAAGDGDGVAQQPAATAQDLPGDRQRPVRLVRPYALTGGRTRPTHGDLELETLVSTTAFGQSFPLRGERREIAALCRDLLSIAEVSARLDLPLGVVRVLVGDMADDALVSVHRPANLQERADLALLERVLYGLRAL
jgi:Protein of unknown function (DUF742)